jgi:hypothetical protein
MNQARVNIFFRLLLAWLALQHKDGGRTFLRNVGKLLLDCIASHPKIVTTVRAANVRRILTFNMLLDDTALRPRVAK